MSADSLHVIAVHIGGSKSAVMGVFFTMETGKSYKSGAFCFPDELGLKHLPARLCLARIYVSVARFFKF